MESLEARLRVTRKIADFLIFASVLLGVALLVQLYSLVPLWLFYSVLAGWVAYVIIAIAVALCISLAYPVSLLLASLTLAVSIPQPEHYSFVRAGLSLASLTFVLGSALQVAVIATVTRYMILKRRASRRR